MVLAVNLRRQGAAPAGGDGDEIARHERVAGLLARGVGEGFPEVDEAPFELFDIRGAGRRGKQPEERLG